MDASATALIVAIVGVIGTLVAPIVSQRLSALSRREEFEQQRIQRHDEYEHQRQEKELAIRRGCYIAVIAGARRYRLELMRYLHSVNEDAVDDAGRERLEEARLAFNTGLAEIQLTASGPVLEALGPIRQGMSGGYTAIMDLERGEPEPEGSFEETKAFLLELWDAWPPAYAAMRADLGVTD